MDVEALKRAKAKYQRKTIQQVSIKLNRNQDQDILRKLSEVDNVQGYIKKLIRQDIENG